MAKYRTVFVASQEELGILLGWLRGYEGLSGLTRTEYQVTAEMGSRLGEHHSTVLGFKVAVPARYYEEIRQEFFERTAFTDAILLKTVQDR